MKKFDQLVSQMGFVDQCIAEFDYSGITTVALTASFNLLFELSWKTLKEFMSKIMWVKEAATGSVKGIIRLAYRENIITDCEGWLGMAAARNDSAHHYCEMESLVYAEDIIEKYVPLVKQLVNNLSEKLSVSSEPISTSQIKEFCREHSVKFKGICEIIMKERGIGIEDVADAFNSMSNDERLSLLKGT